VNHTRSVTRVARRKRLAAPARRAHRPGLQCLSQSSLCFRSGKETLTSRRRSGFRRSSFVPNENTRWRPYLVSAIRVNAPTVLTNDESPIPLSLFLSLTRSSRATPSQDGRLLPHRISAHPACRRRLDISEGHLAPGRSKRQEPLERVPRRGITEFPTE